MNLIFVVDDNYIEQMLVTLNSVFLNHDCQFNIYVVTNGLSRKNSEKLKKFVEKQGGKLQFATYQDSCIDTKKMVNLNWKPIVYYKLYGIFGIHEVDRILYLDCDVIVDGDLTEFYNLELNDCYGAVVEDKGMEQVIPDYETHLKQLMVEKGAYFNGGVMLLNLKQIQEKMTLKYAISQFERYSSIMVFNEQDLLNMIWSKHLLYVDARYNRIASDFCYRKKIGRNRDVVIYHYTTNKPWVNWRKNNSNDYGWCVGKYLQYCDIPETRKLFLQVKRQNRGIGRRVIWEVKSKMGYNPYWIPSKNGIYLRFLNVLLFYRRVRRG